MDDILRDRNFYFYGIRFIYFNIKTTLQWYKETKKYINIWKYKKGRLMFLKMWSTETTVYIIHFYLLHTPASSCR